MSWVTIGRYLCSPVFLKCLKKLCTVEQFTFLNKYNLLCKNQYGFRPGYSTSMALIDLTNKVVKAFEDNAYAAGFFLDLSKAFDTINHDILLDKLSYYGIRGTTYDWFASYLSNRSQCTKYESCLSDFKYITCGVPQGSLLGPLLFIIYVNDICNTSELLSLILYADDTTILYSNNNLKSLFDVVNRELTSISDWFKANRLSLNLTKCNYIIFSNRNKPSNSSNLNIVIDERVIHRVHKYTFLGVFIDERVIHRVHKYTFLGVFIDERVIHRVHKYTFLGVFIDEKKHHITEIESKVSRSIGVINRLKHVVPLEILKTLYCSLVLPYLSYCNIIWGNTFHTNLDKLVVLQKKVVRIITNHPYRSHTNSIFRDLKFFNIVNLNKYQQCLFMYKYLNGMLPPSMLGMFILDCNLHNYNTRASANLHFHLPRHRTSAFQHTIKFSGPSIWNNLPLSLRNSASLSIFKHKLKTYLI